MVFGFGRIEFDGNFIDLARPWTDFQPRRSLNGSSVQAESGVEQTITKFVQWFINARLNLLNPQEKAQLQRLFEYAEDGSSFTLIRDRNLGTYIPFEGGINPSAAPRGLKTNDDVDGTFTRTDVADSAWYLDEGTGLLTLRDGADVPRFPEGKFGAGIQIDGAAVNLITHPSVFDDVAWTKLLSSIDANTTETLDPLGTNTADKMTASGTNGIASFATGTPVGNDAAAGVWLKCSTGTVACQLTISGTGSGSSSLGITVTTEWKRFSHTADTSSFTTNLQFGISIDTNTEIIYMWGASFFDSAEFDKGTVGALSTSSITRNAELLTFPSANVINRDKGTILLWFKPRWGLSNLGANFALFHSGASTANGHVSIGMTSASILQCRIFTLNGTGLGTDLTPTISSDITQDDWNQLVFAYDGTKANGSTIYLNKVLKATSGSEIFSVSEVGTTFSIDSLLDGTNPAFCAVDDILILRNVLTANEVKGIFDLGIGLGVPRNRWTVQLNDQVWNPRWLSSDVYDIPLLLKEVLT